MFIILSLISSIPSFTKASYCNIISYLILARVYERNCEKNVLKESINHKFPQLDVSFVQERDLLFLAVYQGLT